MKQQNLWTFVCCKEIPRCWQMVSRGLTVVGLIRYILEEKVENTALNEIV